jgi:hypothetical protein
MPKVNPKRIAHLGLSVSHERKLEIPLNKGSCGGFTQKPVVLDTAVLVFVSIGEQPIPQIRCQKGLKHFTARL